MHILRENGPYGYNLLEILEDIINGEWDKSVAFRLQYKDENYDPMDDFNYPGSRHHYWSHIEKEINILTPYTEIHRGGRDAPSFCYFESYALVTVTVLFVREYDSNRCVLMLYRSRRY